MTYLIVYMCEKLIHFVLVIHRSKSFARSEIKRRESLDAFRIDFDSENLALLSRVGFNEMQPAKNAPNFALLPNLSCR